MALHVATAAALLLFYWRDWVRIIGGFLSTLRTRRIETSTQRLAWLIVVATVPVGLTGLLLEHTFRRLFAKPAAAAAFLVVNGLILAGGEVLRRRADARSRAGAVGQHRARPAVAAAEAPGAAPARRRSGLVVAEPRSLDSLGYAEAGVIGLFQTLALLAGISRSGVTMVGGLVRGLDHEDAAKFAFLLATPVILAAGVLKVPSLLGPAGAGIHGQVLAGAATAALRRTCRCASSPGGSPPAR